MFTGVRVDRAAYLFLVSQMLRHPEVRVYESHDHGIDPVRYPNVYFDVELQEDVHSHVRRSVGRNLGVLTLPLMQQWWEEERREQQHF
jgi:hypothetical protein